MVFNNNSTPIKRDEELVRWFMEEYQWLLDDPDVEVLYEITEFWRRLKKAFQVNITCPGRKTQKLYCFIYSRK